MVCRYCQHMISAEIPGAKQSQGKFYRANMWAASEDGFWIIRFPKKEGADPARDLGIPVRTPRDILLDPPTPPFAIYLTRTWKKTGWQAMMRLNQCVAESQETFPVGFDYDPVYVHAATLVEDLSWIDAVRADTKISKTELETGRIGTRSMGKIIDAGIDGPSILHWLQKRAMDPAWVFAVFVA